MSEPSTLSGKIVVLTGAAGRLARFIRPALAKYASEVRLCDRLPIDALFQNERTFNVAIEDAPAMARILEGAHAVVHFAGYPREAEWDVILACNIAPVITLWEQARLAGIERIVYASSNHSVGLYPRDKVLDATEVPRPDSRYGVSKVFMETVAQLYSDKHGLPGFGIRIGHCSERPTDARMLAHWISPNDLADLVHVGLTADYTSELVFGVSQNARSWWDNSRAFELGFRPKDSTDSYVTELAGKTSDDPIAEYFQGGSFASHEYEYPVSKISQKA